MTKEHRKNLKKAVLVLLLVFLLVVGNGIFYLLHYQYKTVKKIANHESTWKSGALNLITH